jgi:hypothetical protein
MWVAWSGMAASGITVVNATSITANTPYVGGTLDVTVETPSGMVRLANAYTAAYAVGQIVKAQGGVVATMNGAVPGLIAAKEDLSDAQNGVWIRCGPELTISSGAQSESDGAANTREIVLKPRVTWLPKAAQVMRQVGSTIGFFPPWISSTRSGITSLPLVFLGPIFTGVLRKALWWIKVK